MEKLLSYLKFEVQGLTSSGKTQIINVLPLNDTFVLGQIKWYGAWRKYCFFPSEKCLFDVGCLKEITAKIEQLMLSRR